MTLPIMQFDRYERKGFAGQVSDTSLLDTVTGVATVDVRHGVLVDISGAAASTEAAPADGLQFTELATAAAAVAAKRPAIVSRSHYDQISGGPVNGVQAGQPANLVETGRVWMIAKTDIVPVAMGPVAVAAPSTGNDVVAGLKGTVTNGAADTAIRGLVFTGRVDKDLNGVTIAEVQIRAQTA